MLSTGCSQLLASTNLITLILHCKIRFSDPTVEPLYVPNPTSNLVTFMCTSSGAGMTPSLPINVSTMSQSGTGVVVAVASSNYVFNAGFASIYNNTTFQNFGLAPGSWLVIMQVTGTVITAIQMNAASVGSWTSTGSSGGTIVNSAGTGAWVFQLFGVTNSTGATTGTALAGFSYNVTATTITAATIRVIPINPGLTVSKRKPKSPMESMIMREVARQLGRIDPADSRSQTPSVFASSDEKRVTFDDEKSDTVKVEEPLSPPAIRNVWNGFLTCSSCSADPDLKHHRHISSI